MSFTPNALLSQLEFPAATRRVAVAFSGGLDSTVLLHALASRRHMLPGPLLALHVDHSLQAESADWAMHCRSVAEHLDVEFELLRIVVDPAPGASVEAAAREARYAAFDEFLEAGDCLLTAQHADDQAETFLLQALRGAGPAGLAAMPIEKPLGEAVLLRPLLDWSRADLEAWADEQGIDWIDDPSNAETRFDRNFLRNEVMPRLKERWPALATTLGRSARHCAEAAGLLEEFGAGLLAASNATRTRMPAEALRPLSSERQALLLREWLRQGGWPLPSERVLVEEILPLIDLPPDSNGQVLLGDTRLRWHRDALHLVKDAGGIRSGSWDTAGPFDLGEDMGRLVRLPADERGLDPAITTLDVRQRVGGERIRPAGQAHHRELKKLLQEAGIPPWVRGWLPLLYHRDELVAVADLWLSETALVENGWRIEWKNGPELIPGGNLPDQGRK